LASELAGIHLQERHQDLLARRCRRFGIHQPEALDELLDASELGDPAARNRLIRLLTTGFTGFFRNRWQFDIAAEHVMWTVHRRGKARIWSAAAATGEEPYSMAIELVGVLRRSDPPVSILATDVNSGSIEAARMGIYSEAALRDVDPDLRALYLSEPAGEARWRIDVRIRRMVEFRVLNLASEDWALDPPFDVILCRNVLMYLEAACRQDVLRRMAALLAPDGLLMLDPAEHTGQAADLFAPASNGTYRLRARAFLPAGS
jgi:chemotaxis protein methyltransferase CheR